MTTDQYPQCQVCGRTLAAYLTRPWSMKCRRCGTENAAADNQQHQSQTLRKDSDSRSPRR